MTQKQEMEREWRAMNRRTAAQSALVLICMVFASIGGGFLLSGCITPHQAKTLQSPPDELNLPQPPPPSNPQPSSLVLVVPGGGG